VDLSKQKMNNDSSRTEIQFLVEAIRSQKFETQFEAQYKSKHSENLRAQLLPLVRYRDPNRITMTSVNLDLTTPSAHDQEKIDNTHRMRPPMRRD
jgi:hypothetical protein